MLQWIRRIPLRRLIFFYILSLILPPMIVSAALIIIDSWRKRSRSQGYFVSLRGEPPVKIGDAHETAVQLYTYGEDLYQAMLEAIEQARERVCLETYIWKDDRIGGKFKATLERAAKRGVKVFVIYDAFANLVVPASFKHFIPAMYVLRYPLIPSILHPFQLSTYARDHRKILIADGNIAFIGGYNLGDTYANEWRDTHARLSGPGALEIENAFIDFWNANRTKTLPLIPDRPERSWDPHLSIHRNDPTAMIYPIRTTYLEAIDRAHHHIYLTNAYFLPDRILLQALLSAARRGVQVRILLPAVSNHIVVDWLSHDYYQECLQAGVDLLLYQKAMVHAKTATIDGVWSTVGTANLDRLSLVGNFEINAEIFNPDVAQQMEKIFLEDASHALKLDLKEWQQRPWYRKWSEKALHRLRPLL
jgi:cardiolipin synthase A/B